MYPYKIRGHNWEKTCKHALFLFLNTTPRQPLSHSRCLVQVYWLLSWTGKPNLVNWTRAMTSKSGIHLSFIELYAMCMNDHRWDDPHKFQIVPPLKGNRYTWWLGEKNTQWEVQYKLNRERRHWCRPPGSFLRSLETRVTELVYKGWTWVEEAAKRERSRGEVVMQWST